MLLSENLLVFNVLTFLISNFEINHFFIFRGINLRKIAEQMGGSSGAEVKGTCTEAGQYKNSVSRVIFSRSALIVRFK